MAHGASTGRMLDRLLWERSGGQCLISDSVGLRGRLLWGLKVIRASEPWLTASQNGNGQSKIPAGDSLLIRAACEGGDCANVWNGR